MTASVRLGVVGWPVSHSRSPQMHNAALAAVGLDDWRYQLLPVSPLLLAETVAALPEAGFRGVNVTVPHKEEVLALATEQTRRVRAIGAANTLVFKDGTIHADNTDAPALIAALPMPVADRSVLVLGAGGSARAAVWALLEAGANPVWVWNRTPERAIRLTEEIGGTAVDEAPSADLLVNCTSSGLDAPGLMFKQLPLRADDLPRFNGVVDYLYTDSQTPLVAAARGHHRPVVDGLELLVRQGALSFERFTGRSAPLEVMRAAARTRAGARSQ